MMIASNRANPAGLVPQVHRVGAVHAELDRFAGGGEKKRESRLGACLGQRRGHRALLVHDEVHLLDHLPHLQLGPHGV